jgi:hypothetical protein
VKHTGWGMVTSGSEAFVMVVMNLWSKEQFDDH